MTRAEKLERLERVAYWLDKLTVDHPPLTTDVAYLHNAVRGVAVVVEEVVREQLEEQAEC